MYNPWPSQKDQLMVRMTSDQRFKAVTAGRIGIRVRAYSHLNIAELEFLYLCMLIILARITGSPEVVNSATFVRALLLG